MYVQKKVEFVNLPSWGSNCSKDDLTTFAYLERLSSYSVGIPNMLSFPDKKVWKILKLCQFWSTRK